MSNACPAPISGVRADAFPVVDDQAPTHSPLTHVVGWVVVVVSANAGGVPVGSDGAVTS